MSLSETDMVSVTETDMVSVSETDTTGVGFGVRRGAKSVRCRVLRAVQRARSSASWVMGPASKTVDQLILIFMPRLPCETHVTRASINWSDCRTLIAREHCFGLRPVIPDQWAMPCHV